MDNHQIGVWAELLAQTYYLEEGYEIYTPIMSQSKCDFIVHKDGVFKKVQVKKATENPSDGRVYLQVRLQGKPTQYSTRVYKDGDFDDLVIVHKSGLWNIPAGLVIHKTALTFGRLLEDGSVSSSNRPGFNPGEYKVR